MRKSYFSSFSIFVFVFLALSFSHSAFCEFTYTPVKGVKSNTYADNLLATFGDLPVLDAESATLYKYEVQPFTIKSELKDLTLNYTVPAKIGGIFTVDIYDGRYRTVVSYDKDYRIPEFIGKYDHVHPYYRLEEMRQLFISFKPEPKALKMMLNDIGTTLYPYTKDVSRSFEENTTETSENRRWDYDNGEERPGIRQILFFNKNNYDTPDAFPINLVNFDIMKDYRDNYSNKYADDRSPLKIAAWVEKKLLMPLGSQAEPITWKTPATEKKGNALELKGGESVGNTILQSRRESLLQETIVEAITMSAYVQLKSTKLMDDFLGKPNASSITGMVQTNNSLSKALLGQDVTFEKAVSKKGINAFRFKGSFMSGDKGAASDINGDIKINFIARHTFSQLLHIYHQLQATRLKLLAVGAIYGNSPKAEGDDTGKGPIRTLYEKEKETPTGIE